MSYLYCSVSGCPELPLFRCSCLESIAICKFHIRSHLLSSLLQTHTTSSLVTSISEDKKDLFLKYLNKKTKNLKENIGSLLEFSEYLINKILENTEKIHKKLIKEMKLIRSMARLLEKKLIVNTDIFETVTLEKDEEYKLMSFTKNKSKILIKKCFKSCKKSVSIKIDDNSLLIFGRSNNLEEVDLNNYHRSDIELNGSLLAFKGGCCRISDGKYFLHGGWSQGCVGLTRIIDTYSKDIKELPSGSLIEFNGLCHYNKEVFCFGGSNGTQPISECRKFSLNKGLWIEIQSLPEEVCHTTASTIKDQIFVTGLQTSFIFKYDSVLNTFQNSKFNLCKGYKYIFENWVVSFEDSLFEINKEGKLKKKQNFKDKGTGLNSYGYFKRGYYIYFLTQEQKLYRINTDRKVIECIQISR